MEGRRILRAGDVLVLLNIPKSFSQDACYKLPSSCLHNQLKTFYTADTNRIKDGLTPLNFITRYGGGNNGGKQASTLHEES